ncbi:MAG: peptidoglycan DD-metalloendopeptidase family protein [Anaerolineae bacterium]|nr:peptidoglycan DD-metalloendopeptidase family protein [Anaerolineae bacterium]
MITLGVLLSACGTKTQQQTTTPAPTESPVPTVDELSTLIAMQQRATEVSTATPLPTDTPTPEPSNTPTATPTLTPTFTPSSTLTDIPPSLTVYPTNTLRPTQVTQVVLPTATAADVKYQDHYWFSRPFPRDPSNHIQDYLSRNYPYGSTGYGQFQTHHGVDIPNPVGTSVLAVANGWVIYAGDDHRDMFGPQLDFYGNLVIIEHDFPAPTGEMLYTLYGHLSQVDVEAGQRVKQLEKIGEVGATGVALGAHLHLEVRIGDPFDYGSTYNPDLWLRPWQDHGTLAGQLVDHDGSRVYEAEISLLPESGSGPNLNAFSYADETVNPDPFFGEHYTRGDLPEGWYQVIVRVRGVKRFQDEVYIEPGQTTLLDIVLK